MSGQEKLEDSRLLESIPQQLNLYDNLFPEVESKELQVLFALIRIYLARFDNPQLKREAIMISPELMKRLAITYFDPFNTPVTRDLREALVARLSSVRKYRITNSEVIRRALVTCLYEEVRGIRRKQKRYLEAFMRNPGRSLTATANQLSVTPQAVSRAYQTMRNADLLKLWGQINYGKFKLRHIVAFFNLMREHKNSGEYLRKLLFEDLPFTLSLNADVYGGSSWASFVIPDQPTELAEFRRTLNELNGEVFRDLRLLQIKSFSTGSNLEFFDGRRWFFDPQLWAYGFLEFVRQNKEILRKALEFRYSSQPVRFERLDFLIATILATDPIMPHNEIRQRLKEFDYDVSRPTVTRRVSRLMSYKPSSEDQENLPTIYPYMTHSGLGLNNLSLYLIECEEKYVEEMYYAVGYLPYYFLSETDKGMLLTIRSSPEDVAKFNYMIKGMNEIAVLAYSNRYQSMGIRVSSKLYDKWDETKQRWICRKGELDFLRRYDSLP